MKQRLYWFSILIALLAALTLSAPAMAAGKPVPFKARSSGVVTTVGIDPVAGLVYTHVGGRARQRISGISRRPRIQRSIWPPAMRAEPGRSLRPTAT